jgi:virginiamycin B lyase
LSVHQVEASSGRENGGAALDSRFHKSRPDGASRERRARKTAACLCLAQILPGGVKGNAAFYQGLTDLRCDLALAAIRLRSVQCANPSIRPRIDRELLPSTRCFLELEISAESLKKGRFVSESFSRPLLVALLFSSAAHSQTALPDGAGRQILENACAGCHELERVLRARYSAQDWRTVLHMMRNAGAQISDSQLETLGAYLAENFPEKPKPGASILPGQTRLEFQEWATPTPGSRPHDPLATLDGDIWYTAQMANALGRIDPVTGAVTEFRLDTPMSGPHGLVADRDGDIWFTANFAGYIGKLDPGAGKFVEYKLPDPNARDPHTLLFDQAGMLWFTVQSANMVGRLDPKTGEIKLVAAPTPKSNPYGLAISSKGAPFFCEFGVNKLASINPETMAIHEYPLPHADSRPRRIAIGPDDVIWYTDYARGYLGRFDPSTGDFAEYASPGGSESRPYGVAFAKGAIWYSESGVRPNTLVRFDPTSRTFQTWAIPACGGVVRNMMADHDGNIVLAESGVDRVARVKIVSSP